VSCEVTHDDRELEFFMVKRELDEIIRRFVKTMPSSKSCEQMALKISVGRIKRGDTTYVGVCRTITVSYDGAPVEFRGGDFRYPIEIHNGDQSLTVTAESADYDAAEPTFGVRETLELEEKINRLGTRLAEHVEHVEKE